MSSVRKVLDGRPGEPPKIETDGRNVTFEFDIVGMKDGLVMVMRVDPQSNVFVSIIDRPLT